MTGLFLLNGLTTSYCEHWHKLHSEEKRLVYPLKLGEMLFIDKISSINVREKRKHQKM